MIQQEFYFMKNLPATQAAEASSAEASSSGKGMYVCILLDCVVNKHNVNMQLFG